MGGTMTENNRRDEPDQQPAYQTSFSSYALPRPRSERYRITAYVYQIVGGVGIGLLSILLSQNRGLAYRANLDETAYFAVLTVFGVSALMLAATAIIRSFLDY